MILSIEGAEIDSNSDDFQSVLARCYNKSIKPKCMCNPANPPELYVAKLSDRYIAKRMPLSSQIHDVACELFVGPLETLHLSTLSEAIEEDITSGVVRLKVNFPLKKSLSKREQAQRDAGDTRPAETRQANLSFQGILHLLWSGARFNFWFPAMKGKRHWNLLKYHFSAQLELITVRNLSLQDWVLIPGSTIEDQKETESRLNEIINTMRALNTSKSRQLALFMDIVEGVNDSREEDEQLQLVLRHLPAFTCSHKIASEVRRALSNGEKKTQGSSFEVIVFGSFHVNTENEPEVHQISCITVDSQWIPFSTEDEYRIAQQCVAEGRSFVRELPLIGRGGSSPLLTLLDTHPVYQIWSGSRKPKAPTSEAFEDNGAYPRETSGDWRWKGPGDPLPSAAKRNRAGEAVTSNINRGSAS